MCKFNRSKHKMRLYEGEHNHGGTTDREAADSTYPDKMGAAIIETGMQTAHRRQDIMPTMDIGSDAGSALPLQGGADPTRGGKELALVLLDQDPVGGLDQELDRRAGQIDRMDVKM